MSDLHARRQTDVIAEDLITRRAVVGALSRKGLVLGEVRRLVAEADRLGIPDKAPMVVSGVERTELYVGELSIDTLGVRYEERRR